MRTDELTLRNGIPLLPLKPHHRPVTLDSVKRIEQEEVGREVKLASELASGRSDSTEDR